MSTLRLLHGDCLDRITEIEDESLSAFVCDPPYDLTQASRNGSPRKIDLSTPYGRTRLGSHDQVKKSGGFMGKSWDATGIAFDVKFWQLAYQKLIPGGVVKAFGGTRTFHKMCKAILQAGFVDVHLNAWVYGTGFPKSTNLSKMIRKQKNLNNAEDLAQLWEGYGTALKPAWEPIVIATKPTHT